MCRLAGEGARINGPRVPADRPIFCLVATWSWPAKPGDFALLPTTHAPPSSTKGLCRRRRVRQGQAPIPNTTPAAMRGACREGFGAAVIGDGSVGTVEAADFGAQSAGRHHLRQHAAAWVTPISLMRFPSTKTPSLRPIDLNGAAVKQNRRAFRLGRLAAYDRAALLKLAGMDRSSHREIRANLRRNRGVARGNSSKPTKTALMPSAIAPSFDAAAPPRGDPGRPARPRLGEAAARSLFKLMAYKDEYEVARALHQRRFPQGSSSIGNSEGDSSASFSIWRRRSWGAVDPATRPRRAQDGIRGLGTIVPVARSCCVEGPSRNLARYFCPRARAQTRTPVDRRLRNLAWRNLPPI